MEDLDKLISQAKAVKLTAADQEAQRRSFAYGNTKIENARITHTIVKQAAERMTERKTASEKK